MQRSDKKYIIPRGKKHIIPRGKKHIIPRYKKWTCIVSCRNVIFLPIAQHDAWW